MSTDAEHILITRDIIFQNDIWISLDDLDYRLREINSSNSASDMQVQGRIFGVHLNGIHYFPAYQFSANWEPLSIIPEILARLGQSNCWAIAAWFHFPNSWISPSIPGQIPVSPKTALNRRHEVLLAAENSKGTYFA